MEKVGNSHKNSIPNTPEEKATFKSEILKIMRKEFVGIVTTSEISGSLDIAWNTAEKYLLELAIDGKVRRLKKKGVNLWVLLNPKKSGKVMRLG
jgi:Mn-dependent DtxR family transcriptional regulator